MLVAMLVAVGDLVEDVVVRLASPLHHASDTTAVVVRRRGGSAANVVATALAEGVAARFIGCIGDDPLGRSLHLQLPGDHVLQLGSRTGTVIALVDHAGERTMLSDRGACTELAQPEAWWLAGASWLHLPYYSLVGEPIASTCRTLAEIAHDSGVHVSVDTSSAALLSAGAGDDIAALRPTLVLANELEAATIDVAGLAPLVVIKQGPGPALVNGTAVDAEPLTQVPDTTGAGDAFAAGLLAALADGVPPVEATRRAHAVAARHLRRLGAT
jgi:sugar/nucleoside kinase (ribokinase family)